VWDITFFNNIALHPFPYIGSLPFFMKIFLPIVQFLLQIRRLYPSIWKLELVRKSGSTYASPI
jgi:hypothetical protein